MTLEREDGSEVQSVLAQPKRLALLTYLAVATPRGFHRRDTLLGLFWPDRDTEHARAALSQALYYLRRSLGHSVVLGRASDEIGIDPTTLWCDSAEFEEQFEDGTPASLGTALDLYGGDLLAGLYLADAEGFERWLEQERARLRRRAIAGADRLSRWAEARGSIVEAVGWTRRAVALDPSDEGHVRRLVELLDRSGDRAGAVRAFEEAATRLERDYGLEPAPETLQLMEAVRSRAHSRRVPSAPDTVLPADPPTHPPASASGSPVARPARAARHLRLAGVLAAAASVVILAWAHEWSDPPPSVQVGRSEARASAPLRLAVLPLRTLGPDRADSYVADGLTAELIARLSRLRGVRVAPFTSVAEYDRVGRTATDIGRGLNVEALIEGSVQRVGEALRVTVQLLSASSEEVLWSASYDASIEELLTMQRVIGEDLALRLALDSPGGATSSAPPHRTDRDAYEEYLRGRALLGGDDWSTVERAREHFRLSLERDSTFAAAWGGLARATIELTRAGLLSGREAWEEARHAAQTALRYDEEWPEAHAALGEVHAMADWDVQGAERHLRRAIELDPSDVPARLGYSILLRNSGRFDEALEEIRQARELDSRRPQPLLEEATVLYLAERAEEAVALLESLLPEDRSGGPATGSEDRGSQPAGAARFSVPPFVAYFTLALALIETGDLEAGLSALDEADPTRTRPDALALRAYVEAKSGRPNEALRILQRMDGLSTTAPTSDFHRAIVHVALGEHVRALELLERAATQRSRLVHLLKVEPKFEPLRADARFQDLLRRIGLAGREAARG